MEEQVLLDSGDRLLVRQLGPQDGPVLAEAVEAMSERSRFLRFHSGIARLSDSTLRTLTEIDHHDHEALAALDPATGAIVAVARFIRDADDPRRAELAVTVGDSWQRRGLGTLLLRRLARMAADVGVRHFTADVLAENRATLDLLRRLGTVDVTRHGTTVTVRMDTADWVIDARPRGTLHAAAGCGRSGA
jgi:RimJ/RimL family protein N-acetyltransferase